MIADDPEQLDAVAEWQRLLDDEPRAAELVRAAADWSSPRRTGFLRLLYRLVGETVRSGHPLPYARSAVTPVIELAQASAHPALRRFAARAAALLASPDQFMEYRWCDGGWVFEDTMRTHEPAAEIAAAMLDGRVGVLEGSRRIAELVRHRGSSVPSELQPFVQLGVVAASPGPTRRRRANAPAANDAEPIDHERILAACQRLVESGGAAMAR